MPPLARRRFLVGLASTATVSLAGCATSRSPPAPNTDRETMTTDTADTEQSAATETVTASSETAMTSTPGELDRREANVVGVTVEARDGAYHFDVTLIHDDDGEEGYANWWQVETLAGDQLGRRELLHAHGTREFTRSKTVDIPGGTICVVVRGHDQTHGYGGQAMLVDVETGATRAVRQGHEKQSLADATCP